MTTRFTRRSALLAGAGAAATLAMPAIAQSKVRITIATGGTGGVFYPYGGGLAKILSEKGPNMQATAQVTGGSVDNAKLLHSGDAELGFSTVDSAFDALMGQPPFARDGKQDVRLVAVLYDSFFHLVADASKNVASVSDLKGRRVGVGSTGSSTETITDRVLEAAGLNPRSDVGRDNLSVAESVNALKDGKIAGFGWIGGIPTAAIRDLATSGQPAIRLLDTSKEVAEMQKKFPGLYTNFTLPKGSYAGQPDDVKGLGVPNVLITGAGVRDTVITGILETLFANLADVQAIHPEARKFTLAATAQKTAVPFHPAAERFYKARGVAL
jgi:uncharacterized protein